MSYPQYLFTLWMGLGVMSAASIYTLDGFRCHVRSICTLDGFGCHVRSIYLHSGWGWVSCPQYLFTLRMGLGVMSAVSIYTLDGFGCHVRSIYLHSGWVW